MIRVKDLYPIMLEAFNENKSFSFPIKGTSMLPIFKTGDVVTIVMPSNIRIGDIILFKRDEDTFVLHRIKKIKNDIYYIVGDHQTELEKVRLEQFVAKVIEYKKKDKNKIYYLKGVKYNIYKFIVKFKFIRFIFKHIYK